MVAGAMVLLVAVAAAPHGTVPLQVSLVPHGAAADRVPLKGVLHIVPAGGQGFAAAKAVDVPIEGSTVAPVQLPADLVWEVRTEAEGWWSKPVTVFVGWEDGAAFAGGSLFMSAGNNGISVRPPTTQVTVPHMTSGNYTLCIVPFSAIMAGLKESGGGEASCDGGFLPTLGELRLTLSAPK
jgi:hypothetical protein